MSKLVGAVVVDLNRCKGCRLCIEACPTGALQLAVRKVNIKGYPYVIQKEGELCTGCTSCAIVCPDGCLTVYRRKTEL